MMARPFPSKVNCMRNRCVAAGLGLLLAYSASAAGPDAKLIERGAYLMNSIVACGNCHAQFDKEGRPQTALGLSGGMVFDEEPFKAYARNITPDPETGIGKWTDAQLARAIREGIRPDGTLIGPPMPSSFIRHLGCRPAGAGRLSAGATTGKKCRAQVRVPDKAAACVRSADQGQGRCAPAEGPRQIWRLSRRASRPLHGLPHAVG
jgi:hypothetical protein